MTFFYDLNKKLAGITEQPAQKQLNERDEGKPGKNFEKIAKSAGERYGSKAAGERVAGAVRNKLKAQGKLEEGAAAGYDPETQARIKTATPQQLAQMAQEFAGGPAQYQSELKMLQQAQAELSGQMEEGLGDMAKKVGGAVLNKLGHGSDEDMIRDLQKKAGVSPTGKMPASKYNTDPIPKDAVYDPFHPDDKYDAANAVGKQQVKEKMSPARAKSFAALAEPKDKITFADKIAGAKKEVDEMLGDVAAEAMKNALRGGQKKLDKNKNGKLDANDFAILRAGNKTEEMEESWDDMLKDVEKRSGQMKTGEKRKTSKGEVEKTATGIRHTRSYDKKTGETDTDDESTGEKRGRGRPKGPAKAPERVTAKATKHKGGRKEKVEEGPDEGSDLVKLAKVIQSCQTREQLETARKMAQNFLRKHSSGNDGVSFSGIGKDIKRRNDVVSDVERKNAELKGVEERKLSSSEKEEREDIVKGMKKNKGEFKKRYGKRGEEVMYATATKMAKERGPGNPDRKKKEKTEETTSAGSVAPAPGGKAKGNSVIGKGIYDSLNRDLEAMIAESMSINLSSDSEGKKSLTVTAQDQDAELLAQLLQRAGIGASAEHNDVTGGCGCDTPDCDCNQVEEEAVKVSNNEPDWPTDTEYSDDSLQYSGGLNKPKSTGQTTIPVIAGQDDRTNSYAEEEHDAIKRMMEMAGVRATDKNIEENLLKEFSKFKA